MVYLFLLNVRQNILSSIYGMYLEFLSLCSELCRQTLESKLTNAHQNKGLSDRWQITRHTRSRQQKLSIHFFAKLISRDFAVEWCHCAWNSRAVSLLRHHHRRTWTQIPIRKSEVLPRDLFLSLVGSVHSSFACRRRHSPPWKQWQQYQSSVSSCPSDGGVVDGWWRRLSRLCWKRLGVYESKN